MDCGTKLGTVSSRAVAAVVALLVMGSPAVFAARIDDFQTWYAASYVYAKKGRVSFAAAGELRLREDSGDAWFVRGTQEFRFRPGGLWRFDANVSWVRTQIRGVLQLDSLRLEAAATPDWKLNDRLSFDLRNRIDWWIREGDAPEEVRYRLQPRLTWRLGTGERAIRLYFADEVQYSYEFERLFQNRLIPIGANLPVGRRVRVSLYLMIFSNNIGDGWFHDLVLGQTWTF